MTKDLAPGAGPVARRTLLQGMAGAAALTLLPRQASAQAAKEAPDLAKLVADGKLPKLARARSRPRRWWSSRSKRSAPMAARCAAACAAAPTTTASCAWSATRASCAGTSPSPRSLPNVAEQLGGQRERDRVHLPSAQGHEVVGRQAVHRRRHRVLDRRLRQEHRAVQVAADRDRDRRQGRAPSRRSTTTTVKFTFASPYALFLEQMATPLGQHPTLFAKHYCSQFHPKYNPNVADLVKAGQPVGLGRPVPRQVRRHRDPGALGQCRQADARPVGRHRALYGRRDARGRWSATRISGRSTPTATSCPTSTGITFSHRAGRRVPDARRDLRQASTSRTATSTRCRTSRPWRRTAEGRLPAVRARQPRSAQQVRST